jgi:hypothetical protein
MTTAEMMSKFDCLEQRLDEILVALKETNARIARLGDATEKIIYVSTGAIVITREADGTLVRWEGQGGTDISQAEYEALIQDNG